jgi:superfamily II DNA or RNA helicase
MVGLFDSGGRVNISLMSERDSSALSLGVLPSGRVHLLSGAGALEKAFARGGGHGLLALGLLSRPPDLTPGAAYWRDFTRHFISALRAVPNLEEQWLTLDFVPIAQELHPWLSAVPPMPGSEFIDRAALERVWGDLWIALRSSVPAASSVADFLHAHNPAWTLVGRVCFHLAENRKDPDRPFAFLATYTHALSEEGRPRHRPLGQALHEYAGAHNKPRLLALLTPVQEAAAKSELLRTLVDAGDVFHPLSWKADQAFRFLKDIPLFESAGVVVRVPDWWKARPRPTVDVRVGGVRGTAIGADGLLDFSVQVSLGGDPLSEEEIQGLLAGTDGLTLLRGQWVEMDREKLKEALAHWKTVEKSMGEGMSFTDGMRLLAGMRGNAVSLDLLPQGWTRIEAGPAFAGLLNTLRHPDGQWKDRGAVGHELKASLRPYQETGVKWLWGVNRLGLGACLADDMGLGKTVQVLALLLRLRKETRRAPHLLVAPASLLGNWKAEIDRFAPSLKIWVAHPSSATAHEMKDPSSQVLDSVDLVMTTYGAVHRFSWIAARSWDLVVLDEAQAIKNPGTKQARSVKALHSRHRLALTGTPIENSLGDLWSLFDFLSPGLLGDLKTFEKFVRPAEGDAHIERWGAVRNVVRPFILRRLKTDRSVISDLPEKTEVPTNCFLSRRQAALYQKTVDEFERTLKDVDGMKRRGVILATLMRLKQICNHPSQWLGDGAYDAADSGKFARLKELAESIAARQEKALIFSQFREIAAPLATLLKGVFGKEGLVMHGEIPIKKRMAMVESFQQEDGPPFFVLSLKVGGTGLNLTAASHVIHFDRWWNPAVENQATDRAFRIGQKKNILVHTFICRGTLEEKIDHMLKSKRKMSDEILLEGGDTLLTELSNEQLLRVVSLDLSQAVEES